MGVVLASVLLLVAVVVVAVVVVVLPLCSNRASKNQESPDLMTKLALLHSSIKRSYFPTICSSSTTSSTRLLAPFLGQCAILDIAQAS